MSKKTRRKRRRNKKNSSQAYIILGMISAICLVLVFMISDKEQQKPKSKKSAKVSSKKKKRNSKKNSSRRKIISRKKQKIFEKKGEPEEDTNRKTIEDTSFRPRHPEPKPEEEKETKNNSEATKEPDDQETINKLLDDMEQAKVDKKEVSLKAEKEPLDIEKVPLDQPEKTEEPKEEQPEELDSFELRKLYALKKQLDSRQLSERLETIQQLGKNRSRQAFDILYKVMPEMNIKMREEYIKVLAKWKGPLREKAATVLLDRLKRDQAKTVRRLAAHYLGKMGGKDREDTSAQNRRKKIKKALLISLKTEKSYSVRANAIKGLAELGDVENIVPIAKIGLGDQYQSVRREVVLAFNTLNAGKYAHVLINHFPRDGYKLIREPLIETVYKINKDKAFHFMGKVLNNRKNEDSVRRICARLLANYQEAKYSKKAVYYLAKSFFGEKDQQLRLVIVQSISNYDRNSKAVKKVFQSALKDNRKIREATRKILSGG